MARAALIALALAVAFVGPAAAQTACPTWAGRYCDDIAKLCAMTTDAAKCMGCLATAKASTLAQAPMAALSCMGCSILPAELGAICTRCIQNNGATSGCSLCARAAIASSNLKLPLSTRNIPRLPSEASLLAAGQCFACAGAVTNTDIQKSSACPACYNPLISDQAGCAACVRTAKTAKEALNCAKSFLNLPGGVPNIPNIPNLPNIPGFGK